MDGDTVLDIDADSRSHVDIDIDTGTRTRNDTHLFINIHNLFVSFRVHPLLVDVGGFVLFFLSRCITREIKRQHEVLSRNPYRHGRAEVRCQGQNLSFLLYNYINIHFRINIRIRTMNIHLDRFLPPSLSNG